MPAHLIQVRPDDLSSPEVQALVAEHVSGMQSHTPAGHVHAMAIEGLQQANITFLSAWHGQELCGCGALKELEAKAGEVKSMRTRAQFLRMGVGQAVLDAILQIANERGYTKLYLETGTGPAFEAAHALYLRNGFSWCDAFGSYQATSFNVFMRKQLDSTNAPS